MEISPKTIYLGWEKPLITLGVEYILSIGAKDGSKVLDLSSLLIVIPGSRALRRLKERLALVGQEQGLVIFLPEIITVGALPEKLIGKNLQFAHPIQYRSAWHRALLKLSPDLLSALIPSPPQSKYSKEWSDITARLVSLRDTVLACGKNFSEIGDYVSLPEEAQRWAALAELESLYLAELKTLSIFDKHSERLTAIAQNKFRKDTSVILLGVTDIPKVTRKMIEELTDLTVLIGAPETNKNLFDKYGEVVFSKEALIDFKIDSALIQKGEDSYASIAKVINKLSVSSESPISYDDLTITITSSSLAPLVESAALDRNLPVHIGGQSILGNTPEFIFISILISFITTKSSEAFNALVRHPIFLRLKKLSGQETEKLLQESTILWRERMQSRLSLDLAILKEYPLILSALELLDSEFGSDIPTDRLSALYWLTESVKKISTLTNETRTKIEEVRSLDQAMALYEKLLSLYGDFTIKIGGIDPELTGADFIDELLKDVKNDPIGAESLHSLEVLGWLEVLHDDADFVGLCGIEEGKVPEAINNDPFLPNSVRTKIGLTDNKKRLARDAFILWNTSQSRKKVCLGISKRDSSGEELFPSQLLFLGGTTIEKAALFREILGGDTESNIKGADLASNTYLKKVALPTSIALPTLSVSALATYLRSPYEFYLKNILRLKNSEDDVRELQSDVYGSFTHKVLEKIYKEIGSEGDSKKILDKGKSIFDRERQIQFGGGEISTAKLQLNMLKERIVSLLRFESDRRRSGWETKYLEKKLSDTFFLDVDGIPQKIKGCIDRIDFNRALNKWQIIDYKTSDSAKSINARYIKGRKGKDEGATQWIDLQLPIYREAFRMELQYQKAESLEIECVIATLPMTDEGTDPYSVADWSEELCQGAIETAKDSIRRIRKCEFGEVGKLSTDFLGLEELLEDTNTDPKNSISQGGA